VRSDVCLGYIVEAAHRQDRFTHVRIICWSGIIVCHNVLYKSKKQYDAELFKKIRLQIRLNIFYDRRLSIDDELCYYSYQDERDVIIVLVGQGVFKKVRVHYPLTSREAESTSLVHDHPSVVP
jgi:hypothetical protein